MTASAPVTPRARAHLTMMNRTHRDRLTKVAARIAIERNGEKAAQRMLERFAARARAEQACRILGLDPAEALR